MIAGTYLVSAALLVVVALLLVGAPTSWSGSRATGALTLALRDVLLRLGGRQLGIPHRQRGLPDGGAGAGDRLLLRDRHRPSAGSLDRRCSRSSARRAPRTCSIAYLIGAGVMAIGGITELFLGVRAEKQSLEDIAKPITAEERRSRGAPEDAGLEEAEQRHRSRAERERAGPRRYRPGPGTASFSPFIGQPPPLPDPAEVDREIDLIGHALEKGGPLSREELARQVGSRYWGPGRFRVALREALAEGRARRAGRNLFEAG